MINLVEIQFDGGCKPTNPGNKYGSFAVSHQIERRPKHQLVIQRRIEFGHGTNNEAEFDALIAALNWTVEALGAGGFFPKDFTARVLTDSMVVVHRLRNNSASKSDPQQRMFALANKCLSHLVKFKGFEAKFVSRDKNVSLFGH